MTQGITRIALSPLLPRITRTAPNLSALCVQASSTWLRFDPDD